MENPEQEGEGIVLGKPHETWTQKSAITHQAELLPLTQTAGGLFSLAQQESGLFANLSHAPLTQATLWAKVPCELSTAGVLATQERQQEFMLH
jgi:hypothetical protein